MSKWDTKFLELAQYWANKCSKDPITKVGAVIVDKNNTIVGTGYNGFPRGVMDYENRYADKELKKQIVIHAEVNAILNAVSTVKGCTLYVTYMPCPACAGIIIQSGIRRVVATQHIKDPYHRDRIELMKQLFSEANIEFEAV